MVVVALPPKTPVTIGVVSIDGEGRGVVLVPRTMREQGLFPVGIIHVE
jgi:hypothetical protein